MSTMIRSKPLGYYVNTDRPLFGAFQQQYGSHLERMDRLVKIQLRACLSILQVFSSDKNDYERWYVLETAYEAIQKNIWELYDWVEVLPQFMEEFPETIEYFIAALSEQLRLDEE